MHLFACISLHVLVLLWQQQTWHLAIYKPSRYWPSAATSCNIPHDWRHPGFLRVHGPFQWCCGTAIHWNHWPHSHAPILGTGISPLSLWLQINRWYGANHRTESGAGNSLCKLNTYFHDTWSDNGVLLTLHSSCELLGMRKRASAKRDHWIGSVFQLSLSWCGIKSKFSVPINNSR